MDCRLNRNRGKAVCRKRIINRSSVGSWKKVKPRAKVSQATFMWKTMPNTNAPLQVVSIFPPKHTEDKKWWVRHPGKTQYAYTVYTTFKTKPQAVKFAKSWMRKHPRG